MTADLEAAKRRVRTAFLGKVGVHGVGVRKARNAVAVYVDRDAPPISDEVLGALKQAAAPFDVVVVREDRASAGPSVA